MFYSFILHCFLLCRRVFLWICRCLSMYYFILFLWWKIIRTWCDVFVSLKKWDNKCYRTVCYILILEAFVKLYIRRVMDVKVLYHWRPRGREELFFITWHFCVPFLSVLSVIWHKPWFRLLLRFYIGPLISCFTQNVKLAIY